MATAVQRLRAIHLYRHSLKNMLSWAVRREVFYEEVRRWRHLCRSKGGVGWRRSQTPVQRNADPGGVLTKEPGRRSPRFLRCRVGIATWRAGPACAERAGHGAPTGPGALSPPPLIAGWPGRPSECACAPPAPWMQQEKIRAEFDQLKRLVSRPAATPCASSASWMRPVLRFSPLLCRSAKAPILPALDLCWSGPPAASFTPEAAPGRPWPRTPAPPPPPFPPAPAQDDPIQIERALERGEERLRERLHPDPYIGGAPCLAALHPLLF